MYLSTFVKKAFRKCGVYVFRAGNLPRQIDLWADIKKLQPQPQIILDVGGNIGLFAQAAVQAFSSVQVHSFEPVSETYEKLKMAAGKNPRIHPHNLALGAKEGEALLHLRNESGWNSLAPANNVATPNGRSETVRVGTVDSFCEANQIGHIDLLKTDTEGFDGSVLEGAGRMLGEKRVSAVYSEITFFEDDPTHSQFQDISKKLQRFNYILYGIYEPDGSGERMFSNALFVHKSLIGIDASQR